MFAATCSKSNAQILAEPHFNYVRLAVRAEICLLTFAAATQTRLEKLFGSKKATKLEQPLAKLPAISRLSSFLLVNEGQRA